MLQLCALYVIHPNPPLPYCSHSPRRSQWLNHSQPTLRRDPTEQQMLGSSRAMMSNLKSMAHILTKTITPQILDPRLITGAEEIIPVKSTTGNMVTQSPGSLLVRTITRLRESAMRDVTILLAPNLPTAREETGLSHVTTHPVVGGTEMKITPLVTGTPRVTNLRP